MTATSNLGNFTLTKDPQLSILRLIDYLLRLFLGFVLMLSAVVLRYILSTKHENNKLSHALHKFIKFLCIIFIKHTEPSSCPGKNQLTMTKSSKDGDRERIASASNQIGPSSTPCPKQPRSP